MHIDVFVSFFKAAYHYAIVHPMHSLYMNGPRNVIVSFWQGRPNSAICAELSGYDEVFWIEHASDCEQIVARGFNSFRITVECTIYFMLLLYVVYTSILELRLNCRDRRRQVIIVDPQALCSLDNLDSHS